MTKVAIIYHSGYGHTAKVAEAVTRGAASVQGVSATLIRVEDVEAHWEDLHAADAIVFGAPTYMGSASAPMKAFIDATSKIWMEQKWVDKIAGGFTNSGGFSGDKLNTLHQFSALAAQQGMIWVGSTIMPSSSTEHPDKNSLNRVSSFLGVMTQADTDQGPDVAPPAGDLQTAEIYGARIANAAKRWNNSETFTGVS